jgi:rRNA-processing protein FCF1
MEQVLLDTNFILTCLKEKVDFLDAERFGKMIVPIQVIQELRRLALEEKKTLKERNLADLALQIIEKNSDKIEIISLDKKYVDAGIRSYVERNMASSLIIATLDKSLIADIKGKAAILTIRARKKLALM